MASDDPLHAAVPVEGSLGHIPLGEVLRSLAASHSDGILHLSGSYSSIVCLRGGEIYLAHAETGPSLRQVFLTAGIVNESQWEQAVEQSRLGGTLIDALLRAGESSSELVRAALHEHTVSTLFELLVPNHNTFRFGSGEMHQLGAEFLFPVDAILRAAEARLTEFTEIAKTIPSTDVIVRVVPRLRPDTPQVTISALEWQVLAAADGTVTVADLIETIGLSAFTVFSSLHRLLRIGALETVGQD